MNQASRTAGLIVATLLLASCGIFSKKDPEQEPMELPKIQQTLKVKQVWKQKLGADSKFLRLGLQPVTDGARIYAASYDGNVSAYDPASGKRLWRNKLDTALSAGPAVGAGRVVVTAKDGFVVVLDAKDGTEQWRKDIDGESLARPAIHEESIFFVTIDNRLIALSIFDGRERWSIDQDTPPLTMRGSASPVIWGSLIIAGFDNGRMTAADVDTGAVIWESLVSPPSGRSDLDRLSDIDGNMSLVGQDLYVTGYHGRLAALAAESGQVLWSREISSYEGVSADWNSVYTTRDNSEVLALTRNNGTEIWRNALLLRREVTMPVPFGPAVVAGDFEGYLHFFSNLDGTLVARLRLGGDAISIPPVVAGNRLFVQSDSGHLAAFEIVTPKPKKQAPKSADADES